MELNIFITDSDGNIKGQVNNLLALSSKFILMKESGSVIINTIDKVLFEPVWDIEDILNPDDDEKISVYDSSGQVMFLGPPWNSELIADFIMETDLVGNI